MALKTRYSPLQHFSWDNLFAAFSELPAVQKGMALGVVGLLVVLVLFLPISFATGKVTSLKKNIRSAQKGFSDVDAKIAEYRKAKTETDAFERRFGGAPVSLPPKIEAMAQQSGLAIGTPKDKSTETDYLTIKSIEMKISNATLPQLMELLYNIEHDSVPMRVLKITIKPKPNNRQVMDVSSLEVATFAIRKDE